MSTILETARVRLRPFTFDDVPAFYRMGSDPDVLRYTGEDGFASVEVAREMMIKAPMSDYETHGYGRWAFVLKESDEVIGFCGIKHLPEFELPEIGYRIFPEHWGQGLMTEVAAPTLAYGHEELNLPKIIALVMQDNIGSMRVAEKIGMRQSGLVPYDEYQVWCYEHLAGEPIPGIG